MSWLTVSHVSVAVAHSWFLPPPAHQFPNSLTIPCNPRFNLRDYRHTPYSQPYPRASPPHGTYYVRYVCRCPILVKVNEDQHQYYVFIYKINRTKNNLFIWFDCCLFWKDSTRISCLHYMPKGYVDIPYNVRIIFNNNKYAWVVKMLAYIQFIWYHVILPKKMPSTLTCANLRKPNYASIENRIAQFEWVIIRRSSNLSFLQHVDL